mgnify:CR=1 FL=1
MTSISLKFYVLMVGLVLSTLLCGCIKQFIPNDDVARFGTDRKFPDLNYTGDGNFTDYGRKAGILRFVLDLGAVDLKKENLREFELKGLPEVEFVCYLRVDHPLPVLGRPKDFKAGDLVVEMALEDQGGKVVFRNDGKLFYMSRAPIPTTKKHKYVTAWRQVCAYSIPKKALMTFSSIKKKTLLEKIEDCELLRFIELGFEINCL